MPMKALFQCDHCGMKRVLGGNITKAVTMMEKLGWRVGATVACEACVSSGRADFTTDRPTGVEATTSVTASPAATVTPRVNDSRAVTEVHSDGSCIGANPGYGGWAWSTGVTKENGYPAHHPSTNQQMEIKAATEALRNTSDPVLLVSDSRYVIDCIEKRWYIGWLRRGWKTAAGEPVKNQEYWQDLVEQLQRHPNLHTKWVKGHNGEPLNEEVDTLAREAAEANRRDRGGEVAKPKKRAAAKKA